MPADVFFDTNVIIYFFQENDPRSEVADLLLMKGGRISIQTLNEFVNAALRKIKMNWTEIHQALSEIELLCERPVPVTQSLQEAAIRIAEQYRYGIYDALILAAAISTRCKILYSEDMQDGQIIEGLRIVNPFRDLKAN